MREHISDHRDGFPPGWTDITRFDDPAEVTGIGVAVLKLAKGEKFDVTFANEMAWLLMDGKARLELNGVRHHFTRHSLFDDGPSCIHAAAGATLAIQAESDCEFTVYQCANRKQFAAEIYQPDAVADELRGAGQVGGTCERVVRTIFSDDNSDPNADLVLGEVLTLPGRWSSYPPHHHAQPEIYHYRFDDPKGWGHAEFDDAVVKLRPFDTTRIINKKTHSQVAAPGYAMYYSWVIRHLPDSRYGVPEFVPEHSWIMSPGSTCWHPGRDKV